MANHIERTPDQVWERVHPRKFPLLRRLCNHPPGSYCQVSEDADGFTRIELFAAPDPRPLKRITKYHAR